MLADPPAPEAVHDLPEARPRRLRIGVGAAIVLVVVALGITVLVSALAPVGATTTVVAPAASSSSAPDASRSAGAVEPLLVHVLGAVARPGLYRLSAGARVVDAVAAAGGFAETADRSSVNLARALDDGEQLRVLAQGEAPPAPVPGDPASAAAVPGSPVDLNSATEAQLDGLPRIGPATAQRIIAYRDANGPFTSVDDLLEVPGIGEKTLDGLRELVRV